MTNAVERKQLRQQLERQYEILDANPTLSHLPAVEGGVIRLSTASSLDKVALPCDLPETTENEVLEGLTIQIEEAEGRMWFVIESPSQLREIFQPFVAEVILLEREIGLPAAFDLTLEDWQELWRGKRGRLGPEEQRGLLGEIIVLSSLIQHNKNSIHSWVGPLRELHDFVGRKAHLEIKTTARQPPSVFISEVGQVAPFQGEDELHLILVLLEHGDDLTLPEAVMHIRNQLDQHDHVAHFERVLRRAGYRDEHAQYYRRSYSVGSVEKHQITESSPVLKPTTLGDLPATVRNITYTLDVYGMEFSEITENEWTAFAELLIQRPVTNGKDESSV